MSEPDKDFQQRLDEENERLFGGDQSSDSRGMNTDDLLKSVEKDEHRIPKWFIAIIIMVLLVAYGLTLPFWGDRPDSPRPWFTWGHVAAFFYLVIAGGFVYMMTRLYASKGHNDKDEE